MTEKGGRKKQHFRFNLFLQAAFLSSMSVIFVYSLVYFESCRLHLLSGVLPICEKVDGEWEHTDWGSPLVRIPLFFVQFLIVTELYGAYLICYASMLFIIFASQQMSKEMRYYYKYIFCSFRLYIFTHRLKIKAL